MRDLRIANDNDWEDLSKYLAKDYFHKQFGNSRVSLEPYGRNGQKQYGIDLYSKAYHYVVQCKHMITLRWKDILDELDKTADYPHKIDFFLVTTTARRDRNIQDKLYNRYFHKRSDGSEFEVDVLYWDDIHSLDMVPDDIKYRIFRSLKPNLNSGNNNYKLFKETIPKYITMEDLIWLETYNFSVGYIPNANFEKFLDLYYEAERAKSNISLIKGNRYDLSKVYETGNEFFDNLKSFIKEVNNNIIGHNINCIEVLWLDPDFFPKHQFQKIIANWERYSRNLAQSYREMVLDE